MIISKEKLSLANEVFTADLKDPGEKGIPALLRAVLIHPAIMAREAGRTGPLEDMNKLLKFREPQRTLRR